MRHSIYTFGFLMLLNGSTLASIEPAYQYRVFLENKPIGVHSVTLSRQQNTVVARTRAEFEVSFLMFTAYEYLHQVREIWDNGCLQSISSITNDDGETMFVDGIRSGNTFTVKTKLDTQQYTGCIRSFAYWNPAILKSEHLLNAQTGELLPVSITSKGPETIKINGTETTGRRYIIAAPEFEIMVWYGTEEYQWLALETRAQNGDILRYENIGINK